MDPDRLKTQFNLCMPLFMALGDHVRLNIVKILADSMIISDDSEQLISRHRGLNVNEITRQLNLSRPAISHHLKILKEAGLIETRSKGTNNYYYLTITESTEHLMQLGHLLREFLNSGNG